MAGRVEGCMQEMEDTVRQSTAPGLIELEMGGQDVGRGVRDAADRRAITRCLSCDLDAFAEVVGRHQDRLMWTAYHLLGDREEAADAVQETFLLAYRALDGFGGEGYVGAWLGRIVVNVCVSLLRARAARPVVDRGRWDWGATEGRYAQAEQRMVLAAAMAQLDVQDRAILLLRHVHGLSSQEIGPAVDMPANTVRSRLARARATLRALLPDDDSLFDAGDEAIMVRTVDGEDGR